MKLSPLANIATEGRARGHVLERARGDMARDATGLRSGARRGLGARGAVSTYVRRVLGRGTRHGLGKTVEMKN